MTIARIYIVRHGETNENRQKIYQGQLDTSLNEIGLEQANMVADVLKLVPFEIAYSSDLTRATKTAETILQFHPDVQLRKQEELRERYMGELQGKVWSPGARPVVPGSTIERGDIFATRALNWWKKILNEISVLPPRCMAYHVLVTTHGGFIGTLVQTLVQKRMVKCARGVVISGCRNASVTIIELDGRHKGEVVMYGDTTHLEGRVLIEENVDEADTTGQ